MSDKQSVLSTLLGTGSAESEDKAVEIGRRQAESLKASAPPPALSLKVSEKAAAPKLLLTDDREKNPIPETDEGGRIIQDDPDDLWVVKRKVRVDAFNTVRKMVVVRPSTCHYDNCGKDICDINNLPPYEELDPQMQRQVDMALMSHIARYHGANKKSTAVRKSTLRTSWLNKPLKDT